MKIRPATWKRYEPKYLAVSADLLEQKHRFIYKELDVEIRLPGSQIENIHWPRVRCFRWIHQNGEYVPIAYAIYNIDVIIFSNKKIKIPQQLLNEGFYKGEQATEQKSRDFHKITSYHDWLTDRCFEYWIRVARWKTRYWRLGQPKIETPQSGWGIHLIEPESDARIWAPNVVLQTEAAHIVQSSEWSEIQKALDRGDRSPVWFDYLFAAQWKYQYGDQNGCIIDLAVACESAFRHILDKQVPNRDAVDPSLLKLLSKTSIRQVIESFPKFKFWSHEWQKNTNLKELNKLFDFRNQIMHYGQSPDVSGTDLRRILIACTDFIYFIDE